MKLIYRPASELERRDFVFIGLAGPSWSGKTRSALRLATGLTSGEDIYFIDTENRRGLRDNDMFAYQYAELTAPYSYSRITEAIDAAVAAGAKAVILDNASHAHQGEGGHLDQHEACLQKMAGNDYKRREQMKMAAWVEPKRDYLAFVNKLLRVPAHLIFCFRAKEKLKMLKNQKGKMEPVNIGWQPICTEGLEYEMLVRLILPPNSEGRYDLDENSTKLNDHHKSIFPPGAQIDEAMGAKLAAWARGPNAKPPKPNAAEEKPAPFGTAGSPDLSQDEPPPQQPEEDKYEGTESSVLWDLGQQEANWGVQSLKTWWLGLRDDQRKSLSPQGGCPPDLKQIAADAERHAAQG